jgi:hypothetical protein
MPTEIYKTTTIYTIDGDKIFVTPLKIKYMKQFMQEFDEIKKSTSDSESMEVLAKCCLVTMQQYYPSIMTIEQLEDSFDLDTIYTIIDFGAGIKIKKSAEESSSTTEETTIVKDKGSSWEDLDLVKLESEAFLLGIWKDYDELESSLCMQELTAILEAKRESDYEEKKFLAAIQGVDLEAENNKGGEDKWEAMKARVAAKVSGIENSGGNDITSFTGQKAKKAGFGIGMGLAYEKIES